MENKQNDEKTLNKSFEMKNSKIIKLLILLF